MLPLAQNLDRRRKAATTGGGGGALIRPEDFDKTTQGSGGWYYGIWPDDTDYTTFSTAGMSYDTGTGWWLGPYGFSTPILSPDTCCPPSFAPTDAASVRWVATTTGTATVAGSAAKFSGTDNNGNVLFRVYQNGVQQYEQELVTSTYIPFSFSLSISLNDKIDFWVRINGAAGASNARYFASLQF